MTNWTGDFVLNVNDTRENRPNRAARERIMAEMSVAREYNFFFKLHTGKEKDEGSAEDGNRNINKNCFERCSIAILPGHVQ